MIVTNTAKNLLMILSIIILLTLSITIYYKGHNKSCLDCVVKFKTEYVYGQEELSSSFDEKLESMYQYYNNNNSCLIKWDRSRGYYYGS